MLNREILDIISDSGEIGWILEPQAKHLFSLTGMETPRFIWARREEEAIRFAKEIGFPVVAKVVSPKVLHKSEQGGVVLGIDTDEKLIKAFSRFSRIEDFRGMVVEEMVSGTELIVGAKIDYQFGPVILLGIGGTGVEIYRDVTLRMAPLTQKDVESMIRCLKAHQLLEGYRGARPVDVKGLQRLLFTFSGFVMDLEKLIESIDLNPVICNPDQCVIADARIMLKKGFQ